MAEKWKTIQKDTARPYDDKILSLIPKAKAYNNPRKQLLSDSSNKNMYMAKKIQKSANNWAITVLTNKITFL